MKNVTFLLIVLFFNSIFSQSLIEKEKELRPHLWLGVWDKINSEASLKANFVSYDAIPKYLDFKGTVVEALKWNDSNGENILIQTLTGYYKSGADNTNQKQTNDKSELYVYLFQKKDKTANFKLKWRIYDFTECVGFTNTYTGFIKQATTITDLDNDGVAEISVPYRLICRENDDIPGKMKIIMYEDNTKYALRGLTTVCKETAVGGDYKADDLLKKNKTFYDFLINRWEINTCEQSTSMLSQL